jgi:opacity protein-like surface antigen
MKKLLLLFTIVCCAAPLFGLPEFNLSAGGGGIFNIHWKEGYLKDEYKNYTGQTVYGGMKVPTEATNDAMRQGLFDTKDLTVGGGIYGFFDATYVEAAAALIFNTASQTVAIPNLPDISSSMRGDETHTYTFTQLNLSLMLKYPFSLGNKWKIFPLLGVDSQIALGNYDKNLKNDFQKVANMGYSMPNLGDYWNSLWIKLGGGADFTIFGNLFIRGELLYGFKLNSKFENDMADYWKEDIRGLANGFNFRLGLGYTFK